MGREDEIKWIEVMPGLYSTVEKWEAEKAAYEKWYKEAGKELDDKFWYGKKEKVLTVVFNGITYSASYEDWEKANEFYKSRGYKFDEVWGGVKEEIDTEDKIS